MTNSVHLTLEFAGHGSFGLPGSALCVAALRRSFLDHFDPSRLDVGCIADLELPPFVTTPPN